MPLLEIDTDDIYVEQRSFGRKAIISSAVCLGNEPLDQRFHLQIIVKIPDKKIHLEIRDTAVLKKLYEDLENVKYLWEKK